MDKDEVTYQLKQEAVAVLESEDEKATADHLAENAEDSLVLSFLLSINDLYLKLSKVILLLLPMTPSY